MVPNAKSMMHGCFPTSPECPVLDSNSEAKDFLSAWTPIKQTIKCYNWVTSQMTIQNLIILAVLIVIFMICFIIYAIYKVGIHVLIIGVTIGTFAHVVQKVQHKHKVK